jgi:hypothetical protein
MIRLSCKKISHEGFSSKKSEITNSRKSKWLHSNNHELVMDEAI